MLFVVYGMFTALLIYTRKPGGALTCKHPDENFE